MKMAKSFILITAAVFIVLTAFVLKKAELALENSPLGYVVDGLLIAGLFYGVMGLLKWAVLVLSY